MITAREVREQLARAGETEALLRETAAVLHRIMGSVGLCCLPREIYEAAQDVLLRAALRVGGLGA